MLNNVAGMWRPKSVRSTENKKTVEPFGPTPSGMLCFHENMHFVELLSDPNVPNFHAGRPDGGTAEENRAAVIGNLALFGTYTVNAEGDLIGDVVEGCTFPNWIGDVRTEEHIKATVDGDTMTEVFKNGNTRVDIVWQRIR